MVRVRYWLAHEPTLAKERLREKYHIGRAVAVALEEQADDLGSCACRIARSSSSSKRC
jgi:hypothetical protein